MTRNLNAESIRRHWKKYRPKMYRGLERSGELESALKNAENLTRDALGEAVEAGQPLNQAWEAIGPMWAYLPAESDQPHLGEVSIDPTFPPV